jgi:molybdopterin-guanine dinucleotide biosynthesis protein A
VPTIVPDRLSITGLVLAGGRGSRMGGVDKGLQPWHGRPLIDHVLARFAPQVGTVRISANRHEADYARRGWPVIADADASFDGPLAGLLAGLRTAATRWLAVAPCDAPRLPDDLVARLAAHAGARGAYVVHGGNAGVDTGPPAEAPSTPTADPLAPRRTFSEPLFCLVPATSAASLQAALAKGERRVERWLLSIGAVPVAFDRDADAGAFANFNRLEDLA